MDYFCDVFFETILPMDGQNGEEILKIYLCVLKMNRNLMGLERHKGK